MGLYTLYAITRPHEGFPLQVYYGSYDSIGDTAQVQLSTDPDVDMHAIATWDTERQESIHCRCDTPALIPVVLLKNYGTETPWKGVLCRACLCLVAGVDPYNEAQQDACWHAFWRP